MAESASDIRTRLESVRRERERIERQARLLEEEEHLVRMLHDAERKEQEEKEEHKPGKDQSRHRELPRRQTRSLTGAKSVSTTAGVKRKADEANGFPTGNQADDMGYKVSAYPCQPCIDKDTVCLRKREPLKPGSGVNARAPPRVMPSHTSCFACGQRKTRCGVSTANTPRKKARTRELVVQTLCDYMHRHLHKFKFSTSTLVRRRRKDARAFIHSRRLKPDSGTRRKPKYRNAYTKK
ncbi:hypothetical protein CC2G_003177 [Coprinopsis cinerea AmutBmut pab1-1]|nr:hypothetical protein CC2G_003177 [Coprinopsis cinerea AmutBmut pab1-1]